MIAIRDRLEADVPRCIEMLRLVHLESGYPRMWPEDVVGFFTSERDHKRFVAVEGSEVVGHAVLKAAEGDAAIEPMTAGTGLPAERLMVFARLFVHPGHQRKGIGRMLLERGVEDSHKLGRRPVLDVLKVDEDAIRLYEKAGWERIGEFVFNTRDAGPLPAWVYSGPAPL